METMETKESLADSRVPIALVASEDLLVGQALALLLRGSGYEVKFLPVSSLNEPGALEGVRLLLLTPTPGLSTERRKALLASLKDIQGAAELIVMELVTPSEERRRDEARGESWHLVPWPSRVKEVERRIEAALLANSGPGADPAAKIHELEGKEDDA
jgi:hypothetical protein